MEGFEMANSANISLTNGKFLIVWKTLAGNPLNLRDQSLDKGLVLVINILSSGFSQKKIWTIF